MDRRAKLVARVMAGESYVHAADAAGVSIHTAWKWVHSDADHPPLRRPTISDKKREKIKRDIEAGEISMCQIADRHGVHRSTVYQIRNETGSIFNFRVKRCPTCGSKINTRVCIACQFRESG